MKFTINKVEDMNGIEKLRNVSALTFEGLSIEEESLEALIGWLDDHNAIIDTIEFHVITGKLMNEVYGLTDDNAYPEDLIIVSVTNIDQMKIAIPRFEVGGRWLDDIVDNNLRRKLF